MTLKRLSPRSLRRSLGCDVFHLEHAVPDMHVALGKRKLDPDFSKFLGNGKVEVAPITALPRAHFTAPDHQFKVDRVLAELLKKNARFRFLQCVRISLSDSEQ